MTDALAQWFLRRTKKRQKPWQSLLRRLGGTEANRRVDRIRRAAARPGGTAERRRDPAASSSFNGGLAMPWPLSQDYNEAIQTPAQCFARSPTCDSGEVVTQRPGPARALLGQLRRRLRCCMRGSESGRSSASPARFRPCENATPRSASTCAGAACRSWSTSSTWSRASASVASGIPSSRCSGSRASAAQRVRPRTTSTSRSSCRRCAKLWAKLASRLREANLAHGDLQHGNVLLVPGRKAGTVGLQADGLRRHVRAGPGVAEEPSRSAILPTSTRSGCAKAPTACRSTVSRTWSSTRPCGPWRSVVGRCGSSTTTATTCCSPRLILRIQEPPLCSRTW